jgi:hypothetical protein
MKTNYEKVFKSIMANLLVLAIVLVSAFTMPVNSIQAATAAKTPTFSKSYSYILIKDTYQLSIKNKVKESTYAYASSNKKIATVSKDGKVKGISKGTATITCKIKTPKKVYNLKCKVTIIKPATDFKIYNKITRMNVGQEYDLNRVIAPASSNDKTVWSSSNKSIAAPDQNGKFTALKEGTVTIKGKTLGGPSDSVKIKVVDAEGIVSTQEELDELLGTGISKITIKTDEKVIFTIPEGDNSTTKLVVDAPKADVKNYGVFASIDIKKIAANTWYEYAVGNLLNILAVDSRIVVEPKAVVKIEVSESGAKLIIVNNGVIQEVKVDKPADINISGSSKESVPLIVNVPNIKITSSVPLNVECIATAEITLLKGAEGTKIDAATKEAVPTVKGDVEVKVTVAGSDSSSGGGTGGGAVGGPGGGYNPPTNNDNTVVVTKGDGYTTYTLAKSYTLLKSMTVAYNNQTYSIDSDTLSILVKLLGNETTTILFWQGITSNDLIKRSYSGQSLEVTGSEDVNTKVVTFTGGKLSGKSYRCTLHVDKSITVQNIATSQSYTFTKVNDYTLRIETSNKDVTFTPSF